MRLLAALAVAAAVFVAPANGSQPADAACPAPAVKFKPARVVRGGVITVTGQYFGDDCFDTGTLPAGVGALGVPLAGLSLAISQGDKEFIVATGSADSDYEFQVDVVVPAGLEPGNAVLNIFGSGDARLTIDPPIVISSAPPVGSTDAPAATFGSEPPQDTVSSGTDPPSVLPAEIPDAPVATAPPLSVSPTEDDSDSSDLQRAIAVGVAGVVAIAAVGFAVWSRSKRGR